MADDSIGHYRVDRVPNVDAEIRAGAALARAAGMRPQFIRALKEALRRLETEPVEWGDPEYHTRQAGGVVCHAISPPVIIRYVAFQNERRVCILKVTLMGVGPHDSD